VSSGFEHVNILGVDFASLTEDDALAEFYRWIDAKPRKTHTVVTVNVAILVMMRDDEKLRESVEKADLVVVDGQPLVWTSRMFKTPVPERVSGVDLMNKLLETGGERGLRLYLLGTTQERLEKLASVIREKHPGIVIAGMRNGYFKEPDWPDVVRGIREANADVLLVGMPAPFKEIWCERFRDELATPVVMGVGGAFDVIAGFVQRAPKPLQKVGLEWAWRMAMEPRKLFMRYLTTNSRFIGLVAKEATFGALGVRRPRD
jgi:N-acetylglucosaminyldiphosphoundecaprenol N-acetyl-beta-D-mannosaminyltransferase